MSSGSSRAASAVEPVRSQNSTVSCRRSPSVGGVGAAGSRVAIAASIRFLSPIERPSSLRSSLVRDRTTSRPMPLAWNAGARRDRPARASHSSSVVGVLTSDLPWPKIHDVRRRRHLYERWREPYLCMRLLFRELVDDPEDLGTRIERGEGIRDARGVQTIVWRI